MTGNNQATIDRFTAKVDTSNPDGCWPWIGCRVRKGYGQFRVDGKGKAAHRVAYELFVGPIPDGMNVCHSCDNPPCVRPNHLWLGSTLENVHDRDQKGRGVTRSAPKGEKHPMAKLSEGDVKYIRALLRAGHPQGYIASEFGVSSETVCNIKAGKSWGWMPCSWAPSAELGAV